MEVTTTIAEAIAHAAEPHLADLPLERAERYQEGALHLRQVRGNRFMRDRYFVYRVALASTEARRSWTRWFLVRRACRQIIEHLRRTASRLPRR